MPKFNLSSILSPRSNSASSYNSIIDMDNIRLSQAALDQGGVLQNPNSYDQSIKTYQGMSLDMSLSKDRRDEAKLRLLDVQKKQQALTFEKDARTVNDRIYEVYNGDLREISANFPDNPYEYSRLAVQKVDALLYGMDNINDQIENLDLYDQDTAKLKETRDLLEADSEKYNNIIEAYETNNNEALRKYTVIYSVDENKVKQMRIIDNRSESYGQDVKDTTMRFSSGKDGGMQTTSSMEGDGMKMALQRSNLSNGDVVKFGGTDFTFNGYGFVADNEGRDFYADSIRYAPVGNIKAGSFVRDSENKVYYVNTDKTYSPINSQKFRDELGYNEADVFDLTPSQQVNVMRGNISPLPEEVMPKYTFNDEATIPGLSYFDRKEDTPIKKIGGFLAKGFENISKLGEMKVGEASQQIQEEVKTVTEGSEILGGIKESVGGFITGARESLKQQSEETSKRIKPYIK